MHRRPPLWRVVNRSRRTVLGQRIRPARTFLARLRGLQCTHPLEPGEGLWLIPAGSIHTFFMRYPLDLLFLDPAGKVLAARPGVRPWRAVFAAKGARSCLELPAGRIAETDTEVGDELSWEPSLSGPGGDRVQSSKTCRDHRGELAGHVARADEAQASKIVDARPNPLEVEQP